MINHKHFAHGDKMLVNALLNEKWLGQPEYRLCLGFHPEGHVPEGQRPVGWGTIAIKLKKEADPTHYPFRICHMGYFCTFRKDKKSELVRRFYSPLPVSATFTLSFSAGFACARSCFHVRFSTHRNCMNGFWTSLAKSTDKVLQYIEKHASKSGVGMCGSKVCVVVQYTSVTGLVNAMKKALQEIQKEQKQAEDSRQAQHAAQAQRQQPYGGYPQMPPPSGGYQGQYVHHMGYGGGQAAGFVGNARGY